MSQPPSDPPTPASGTPTATPVSTGSPRPPNAGSQFTIATILQNLPNLFGMYAKGTLTDLQINQLRQLMHTHYRQVIASALHAGQPNPLLSLPPAIDPTLPWNDKPALISKDAYAALIESSTAHLKQVFAKRAQESQGGQTNGNGSQAGLAATATPQRTGTPPIGQVRPPAGGRLPNTSSGVNTPGGTARPPTASGQQIAPAVMDMSVLKQILSMAAETRATWMKNNPERAAQFTYSLKYWQAKQNASTGAGPGGVAVARPPPMNAAAGPSRASPAPGGPRDLHLGLGASGLGGPPMTIAPSLLTPPIPQPVAVPLVPSASGSAAVAAGESQQAVPTTEGATLSNSDTGEAGLGSSSAAANGPTSNEKQKETSQARPGASESVVPAPPLAGPIPSAQTNPQSTPAFATALPDPRSFALRPPPPPPPPPETEDARRKRKWKEFVGELAPGLEMEMGMDEVLGNMLDELLDEGLKGAVRLAKHRKADKVELKDMAYFVDTQWDMSVPGFDALGHTHRHLHVPPERERRKAKAVAPRAVQRGRPRDED
ncbi:hypothetical protein IAU60_006675 [Kwoniella sp. DSM 27419]